MKIAIIGTGYVGLTTGVCLAELGNQISCHDVDSSKIASLNGAVFPIYELGTRELIARNVRRGRLRFTTELAEAVSGSELVLLAVNTPSDDHGDIDLTFIVAAVRSLAPLLQHQCTIVIKSTVTPGTADRIAEMLHGELGRPDLHIASNPEFLREGRAIADFLNPDRIVIGAHDPLAVGLLTALFKPLSKKGIPLLITTPINAEMIKFAANAFLALKIGFTNAVADLCESLGGDMDDVKRGIGLDHRIGEAFLNPGPGFGGSCFPKDTRAFAACGRAVGAPQTIIEAVIRGNEDRKIRLAGRIVSALGPSAEGCRVAVLGLAFKADTDDMREAPSLTIIPILQKAGILVAAHDPRARVVAQSLLSEVEWHDDPLSAVNGADAVVVLTEWEMYRRLELGEVSRRMRGRHLFDYRNLYDADTANSFGLHYTSLGRAPANATDLAPLAFESVSSAAE